jgi:hypothetical protein
MQWNVHAMGIDRVYIVVSVPLHAVSSIEAFWSSSETSAVASFSCFSSASAETLPLTPLFSIATFLALSVARWLSEFASSSSRRLISS